MKNLVIILSLVFGLLLSNSIFAQSNKLNSGATDKQTRASSQSRGKVVFSDAEVTVYRKSANANTNVYTAINKGGQEVNVDFEANALNNPLSQETTTAKTINMDEIIIECKCIKKIFGICQKYSCKEVYGGGVTSPVFQH